MENETIRTKGEARIMLSYSYCKFEFAISVENPNGIKQSDLDNAGNDCREAANKAIEQFKNLPAIDQQEEMKRLKTKIQLINNMPEIPEVENVDPKEVEQIAALPLYTDVKKPVTKKK